MAAVKDVWEAALPPATRLLAGRQALSQDVSWALVLKPRPPGLEAAHGGELILLSLSTLPALDPALTLERALSALHGRASAVAVRGDISHAAVLEAEELRLPLLQLPPDAVLAETERDVLQFLSEQRTDWYRRKHSILHDLTTLALQGRGMESIAAAIAEMTGHAVLFEDERGEPIARIVPTNFAADLRDDVERYLDGDIDLPEVRAGVRPAGTGLGRIAVPVLVNAHPAGMVSFVARAEALGSEARLVLEAAATAGAVELARELAVRETVHRIQGDVVSEIIAGNVDADVLQRARRLGYDPEASQFALALQLREGDGSSEPATALARRLRRALRTYEVVAPVHLEEHLVTVFYPVAGDARPATLKRSAERLVRDLADSASGHRLSVGASKPHSGPEGYRLSYMQARRSLELGHALDPNRNVTFFGDLGIYRVLFAMRETAEIQEFHHEMLGRLQEYDREKGTELVATLEAFLCANNATEVAARLNLHRNSLLYRLRRIREIGELDLDDAETRLALHLAIKVGETLRSGEAAGA